MSDKCIKKDFIYNVLCFSASWCLSFFKTALPKETSPNSVIIETSSYLSVTILVL